MCSCFPSSTPNPPKVDSFSLKTKPTSFEKKTREINLKRGTCVSSSRCSVQIQISAEAEAFSLCVSERVPQLHRVFVHYIYLKRGINISGNHSKDCLSFYCCFHFSHKHKSAQQQTPWSHWDTAAVQITIEKPASIRNIEPCFSSTASGGKKRQSCQTNFNSTDESWFWFKVITCDVLTGNKGLKLHNDP